MQRLYVVMCTMLLASCGFSRTSHTPQVTSQPSNLPEPNFESQTGGFAIWIPTDVEPNDETQTGTCIGTTREIHLFLVRGYGAYWLVQYCDPSADEVNRLSDSEILDQARNDALADAFGTLKAEREITFEGYPGRHIIADSALRTSGMEKPDGIYKARVFLIDNRVYRIATYFFNDYLVGNLEKMDEFLESFALLK